MAYFAHAFQKMLLVNEETVPFNVTVTDSGLEILPGQLGMIDPKTNLVDPTPDYATTPMIYLAQGSFYPEDKIGQFHGGYQETVKSKGINPKYVTEFYKVTPADAQNQILTVEPAGTADSCFMCNETYYLMINITGSPVFKTLLRSGYTLVPAFTGCCVDPENPVAVADLVVFEAWAEYINNDPILSNFLLAEATATELVISVAYMDTQFGTCSFHKNDSVQVEPIVISGLSQVLENGDSCDVSCIEVTETQEALQGKGFAGPLLKEYILSHEYAQERWQNTPRLREVLKNTTLEDFDTSVKYVRYGLLHSVPRFNNPSGTFDNDQYLITIAVPVALTFTAFEAAMNAYLTSAGNPVQMELIG